MKLIFCENRRELGEKAGYDAVALLRERMEIKGEARILLYDSECLEETLEVLRQAEGVDWSRVQVFSAAEVADPDAANRLPKAAFEYPRPGGGPEECERYARRLAEKPIDLALLSVGADGSLAAMGPDGTAFKESERVRELETEDGAKALAVTIPGLLSAAHVFCCVTGAQRAAAVKDMCEVMISEKCPATALRRHADAKLYVDRDSARLIRV